MKSSMAEQNRVNLGSEASFGELPARVVLHNRAYYLVRNAAGYQLFSTVCPHQGGEVIDKGDCFECPHHGWRFARATGVCLSVPKQHLSIVPVIVENGNLYAEVAVQNIARAKVSAHTAEKIKCLENLDIKLHAHACLEIKYRDFSLLTDPWLEGTAFFGSWMQYPPTITRTAQLHPNAILITHEHSDHFSEATIVGFDRATRIYVPDFPNRRLVNRLKELGFEDVRPLAFGATTEINPDITVTCYEPESLWNDCIALIEVDGFRLLNLNDAGLNRRIAAKVAPVDAVAAQFSTGASGYPLTWNHLTDTQKIDITERARQGKLQMLKEAMELYDSSYLLPFASHFALWHPEHRQYMKQLRVNTIDDVVAAFDDSDVRVVDFLPGETWNVVPDNITRVWKKREQLYGQANILKAVERRFDQSVFEKFYPTTGDITRREIADYFLSLNDTSEIAFCENLTFLISAREGNGKVNGDGAGANDGEAESRDFFFEVNEGRLKVFKGVPETVNLTIEIPGGILARVVRENLSWDEAFIGYWCRFSRTPDVYHAGFWRLLQAPYFNREARLLPTNSSGVAISSSSTIADVIESYGESAERILRRYGLYCSGCQHSTADSLAHGARCHGIADRHVERMISELNRAFHVPAIENLQAETL